MIIIRPFEPGDWPAVWGMLAAVFGRGDTYAYPPDTTEAEARVAWIEKPAATYVALVRRPAGEETVGTYYLKPNQPGLGDHVCNCGYIVAPGARGLGIGSTLCLHSQAEAVRLGFRAMQFNLVVVTNEGAIRLWQKHGFDIVGTLPGAFHHPERGYVDALVMYKVLVG